MLVSYAMDRYLDKSAAAERAEALRSDSELNDLVELQARRNREEQSREDEVKHA